MTDLVERLASRSENGRVFHSDRTLFAEAAEAIATLRAELAEQARLNGMGFEREAEAYRRGVEDAAKVAENGEWIATGYGRSCAARIAAAIRELKAKDGEEGDG